MRRHTLITGGAGFVGTNLADRLLSEGERVVVLDNVSRAGVEQNVRFLTDSHSSLVDVEEADVRDRASVARAMRGASRVFHLAGQVAVTTSLDDPMDDATTNVQGTLNVLEEVRAQRKPVPVVFTSTNKVYGTLDDVELVERETRYEPAARSIRARGIGEWRPLQFCTPYGCSKGAADQYVVDYSHSYGIPTVVFRMSCIYGTHQMGNEDQGWVAHFLIRALEEKPITVYGDGRQVRDILYVDDLVDALRRAGERSDELAGRAFNIGGGPANRISLLDLIELIAELRDEPPAVEFGPWRQGDQRYYVSDTAAYAAATGWRASVDPAEGVRRLHAWLEDSHATTPRATAGALA
jgi:CDP-paratose 2-epimerase